MHLFLLLFLLTLSSCHSRSFCWRIQRGTSTIREFDSSKLLYSSAQLDLEFFRIQESVDCFLLVKGSPIYEGSKKSKEVFLKIDTQDRSISVSLIRHSGGQKFTFTQEAKEILCQCLRDNKLLKLSIGAYTMTINSEGFEEAYKKFSKPTFMQNPFYLPL